MGQDGAGGGGLFLNLTCSTADDVVGCMGLGSV